MLRTLAFLLFVLVSLPAAAEIEKVASICKQEICFYWWPKLPAVKGWHQDDEQSYHYGANAQAPDGKTFATADAVIYATAPYKPRTPEIKTLQALIDSDQQQFKTDFPRVEILESEPTITGDGQTLRSFTYTPTATGNWEVVSYGEESEFFLIFTVSSRTKEGLAGALEDYKRFIHGYRAADTTK